MPLWQPDHRPDVAPEDAVAIVHDFVRRCRDWATELELPKRRARVQDAPSEADVVGLLRWISYLEMTEHTLRELEDGTLDRWFLPDEDADSSDS